MRSPVSPRMLKAIRQTAVNHMSDQEGMLEILKPVVTAFDRLGTPKQTYETVSSWPCRLQVIEQRKPLVESQSEVDYVVQHHRVIVPIEAEEDFREYDHVRYKGKIYQATAVADGQTENAGLHVDLVMVE